MQNQGRHVEQTGTVVSLKEVMRKRRWNALRTSVDERGLFDVPMEDITQVLDSANDSLSDPVHLGVRAQGALQALVDEFCLERLPATLAEVQAVLQYGWYLRGQVRFGLKTHAEDEATWNQSVDEVMAEYTPAFIEPVQAYRRGDRDALRRVHAERLTLAALAERVSLDGEFRFHG